MKNLERQEADTKRTATVDPRLQYPVLFLGGVTITEEVLHPKKENEANPPWAITFSLDQFDLAEEQADGLYLEKDASSLLIPWTRVFCIKTVLHVLD